MPNNPENAGAPRLAPFENLATWDPPGLRKSDTKLIQIVDAALADAAVRSGSHLTCHPGCTQCCHGAFAITALDAQRLRFAMTELGIADPAQAAEIQVRAQNYLAEFAPSFPGNPITGILGTSEEAESAFEDFANEAPCPALNPDSGLCDLYLARPVACRTFGPPIRLNPEEETPAYALCELCFTTATEEEIAAAEMQIPQAEEQEILQLFNPGETIVAYCLVDQK